MNYKDSNRGLCKFSSLVDQILLTGKLPRWLVTRKDAISPQFSNGPYSDFH